MPKPSDFVNVFLKDKLMDGLEFISSPRVNGNTLDENIKLNRQKLLDKTLKKQEEALMQKKYNL